MIMSSKNSVETGSDEDVDSNEAITPPCRDDPMPFYDPRHELLPGWCEKT